MVLVLLVVFHLILRRRLVNGWDRGGGISKGARIPNVEMYKCGKAGKRGKGARFPVAYGNAESRRSGRAEDKPCAGEVGRNMYLM